MDWVLVVIGALALMTNIHGGDRCAKGANLAGVFWHLFFVVNAALLIAISLNGALGG